MPAENRQADVLRALRDAGSGGLTLAEAALAAGVAPKTARKHLSDLVASGHSLPPRRDEAPPRHLRWYAEAP